MKSPIDAVKGRITGYDAQNGGFTVFVPYTDYYTMIKRGYKDCLVQLCDSRPLSSKQRNCCYALLREISDYTGMGLDPTKEWMKLKFISEDLQLTADKIFSLSAAPMSLVCAFQRFLIRFILDWDIPTSFQLLDMVDDYGDYMYGCLINKKCCICGRKADLHHVHAIGMGADRDNVIHEGLEVMPLCREHHTEWHTIDHKVFNDKYHLRGGVKADKAICKVYKLKTKKDDVEENGK